MMYAEKSTVVYYMLYIRGKFALRLNERKIYF